MHVHPQSWPQAHSRGLVDAATEARIDELLARMSLEEKVGQIIQTDISAIVPEDLRRYPLGSILAGGGGGPNGDDRATPLESAAVVAHVSLRCRIGARPGHAAIPLMFGIDAVHGHDNILAQSSFRTTSASAPRTIPSCTPDRRCHRRSGGCHGHRLDFRPDARRAAGFRWGRSYEGFAQDPALVREYARAAVEGLQGPAGTGRQVAGRRVAATAKHFLGDGGTSTAWIRATRGFRKAS